MKKSAVFISIFLFSTTAVFGQACTPTVKVFKIQHVNVESLEKVANDLLSEYGKLSVDPNTESLIVVDCPDNLVRIGNIIKQLDVAEKQVEIKVLVAEITSATVQDIGLTAGRVIIPQGDFIATLDLLKKNKDTNIRNEMTLRTLSNRPAQLQVTKDEIIGNEVAVLGGGSAVITSPITQPIGNFLEVLPSVNNDNTINVIVRPLVSSIDGHANPSESSILTQVVVNNADTIAIGGADIQKQESQTSSTPFAVPLSRRTATKNKKVVMFLTVKIID